MEMKTISIGTTEKNVVRKHYLTDIAFWVVFMATMTFFSLGSHPAFALCGRYLDGTSPPFALDVPVGHRARCTDAPRTGLRHQRSVYHGSPLALCGTYRPVVSLCASSRSVAVGAAWRHVGTDGLFGEPQPRSPFRLDAAAHRIYRLLV